MVVYKHNRYIYKALTHTHTKTTRTQIPVLHEYTMAALSSELITPDGTIKALDFGFTETVTKRENRD